MGRMQRDKGARYELELVNDCKARGVPARRTAQMQSQQGAGEADIEAWPGWHIEAKRQERVQMLAWCKQAEAAAGGSTPVVVWRTNGEPSRVTLLWTDFLELMANGR